MLCFHQVQFLTSQLFWCTLHLWLIPKLNSALVFYPSSCVYPFIYLSICSLFSLSALFCFFWPPPFLLFDHSLYLGTCSSFFVFACEYLLHVIFFSLLLFCVNFYCFIYFSTSIGPKNMILMSFWRGDQALQNCRFRPVLTAKDRSFFGLWFSKIKRPDHGPVFCGHKSGPVTVFLQSCDWTFEH